MKLNILRITGLLGLIVALVFTLVACGDDEPDDPVADFYNGKTVKIVVGHTAGGSYDFFGRTVAQYLSEHIPGNPTVIVENQPSAGSIATANYIASAAPKDGTEIMTSTSGVFMAQVLGSEGVQYDAADFNFLGSGSSTPLILVSSAESGVTSVDEILPGGSKSLKMACGGLGEPLSNAALLAQEFLKANMSMVCGYEGLSAMYLAIEQDEVNGIFTIPNSLASRQANGESVGWTVLGVMAEPGDIPNEGVMAGAPSLYDLAPDAESRRLMRLTNDVTMTTAQGYWAPPGVPADRAAALRAAVAATFADARFIADVDTAGRSIQFKTGQQQGDIIQGFLTLDSATTARLKELLSFPGT